MAKFHIKKQYKDALLLEFCEEFDRYAGKIGENHFFPEHNGRWYSLLALLTMSLIHSYLSIHPSFGNSFVYTSINASTLHRELCALHHALINLSIIPDIHPRKTNSASVHVYSMFYSLVGSFVRKPL